MSRFRGLFQPSRSLAMRLILGVSLTAAAGIVLMLLAAIQQFRSLQDVESDAVMRLAETRTAERLDGEATLLAQRLRALRLEREERLAAIAAQPIALEAVRRRNEVEIAEVLGKRALRAGFTGLVVIDHRLQVIASDRAGGDFLSASAGLDAHDLRETFSTVMDSNDRARPQAYRYAGGIDPALASILMVPPGGYGFVVAWPVFDEFGDPVALLLAHRRLRLQEPLLEEFARTTRSVVALTHDGELVAQSGGPRLDLPASQEGAAGLVRDSSGGFAGRCREALASLRLCVLHAAEEIAQFRREIEAIGTEHRAAAIRVLMAIGLGLILALMLVIARFAGRVTAPLRAITGAVDRISDGEWRVEVPHAARADEIGTIARAVGTLQASLVERDRLRQEMARIDAINQRRLVLDGAVSRFEDGISVVLRNIGSTLQALALTADALSAAARQTRRQAEAILSASEHSASRATEASSATDSLDEGIREIVDRIRSTAEAVHAGEDRVREMESRLASATPLRGEAESALAGLQSLLADLNTEALRLAGRAARGEGADAPVDFATRSLVLRDALESALGGLREAFDRAEQEAAQTRGLLGSAYAETRAIAVVAEEQRGVASAIREGLEAAASALAGLDGAVLELRRSVEQAQEASTDFVQSARKMAEDAQSIDAGIRSFVRDVAA